jgi:transposase
VSLHGQIVLGIDTHKHAHVAVVLDGLGRVDGQLQFPTSDAGTQRLLAWNREHGGALLAGVEGTGSYGYQLARALQCAGLTVLEVNRPDRANRRRKGKSDPVDAEAAARAVGDQVIPQGCDQVIPQGQVRADVSTRWSVWWVGRPGRGAFWVGS